MTSHPYSHTKDSILSLWVQFCFPFFKCGQQGHCHVKYWRGPQHLRQSLITSQKHIFFEENTYNQMAQKHSDGHVLWGDKWTLKNLKINTLYKRLGFSFNTWRIKLCLKCSDLLKEELWSIFWVVTKDWNSLPVKNRTEPTKRETW